MLRFVPFFIAAVAFAACSPPAFQRGTAPTLQGSFDEASIAPGGSATLTWSSTRSATYVLFVAGGIAARGQATAGVNVVNVVPATSLQVGANTVVITTYTSDGAAAHLTLSLTLAGNDTTGGSSAGSSAGGTASAGSSSGSSGGIGFTGIAIGGTLANFDGGNLVLSLTDDNAADSPQTLTLNAPATTFMFAQGVTAGANYTVTITTNPTAPSQTCTFSNSTAMTTGTATADVTTIAISCTAPSQAETPRIMFTDLTQAPPGAYVTLYGFDLDGTGAVVKFDDTTAATVKVDVLTAPARGGDITPEERITVQVPSLSPGSHPIYFYRRGVLKAAGSVPFTVVSGRVLFYSLTGTGSGTEAAPAPYSAALSGPQANDVRYLRQGAFPAFSWSGSVALALVGYPGETVTVTSVGQVANISGSNLTIANLTLGPTTAVYPSSGGPGTLDVLISGSNAGNVRVVGNTFPITNSTMTQGTSPVLYNDGIVQLGIDEQAHNIVVLGNEFQANDDSSNGVGGGNITIAFDGDVNTLEIGFNEFDGCRERVDNGAEPAGPEAAAVNFHPYNNNITAALVHHNLLHACDAPNGDAAGEVFGLQAGGGGDITASIENNLIVAGEGDGRGTFYIDFTTAGADKITVNHNTITDTQSIINIDTGSTVAAVTTFDFENNIVYTSSVACTVGSFACGTDYTSAPEPTINPTPNPTSSHNIYLSTNGDPPDGTGDVVGDPMLAADGSDSVTASSALAIDKAVDSSPDAGDQTDYIGNPRVSGSASDIGAFEFQH